MATSYIFTDRSALDKAIEAWISDEAAARETYGDINNWDVSEITDFSELFKDKGRFNSDISDWDVSNGTDFAGMFTGARSSVSYTHLTLPTSVIV